jgi:hypothetical protein
MDLVWGIRKVGKRWLIREVIGNAKALLEGRK